MDAGRETIHVLHADDDSDFGSLAATFVERESDADLTVTTVESAAEGLTHLADAEVDCIVSDYEMPRMDGLEFLRAVRNRHAELPFILFTGRGSEEVARDAFRAGATDYMQKETGVDQYAVLANRVSNAVSKYRAQTASERYGTVIEALDNAVFNLDADARFTSVNDRFVTLLGYDRGAVLGERASLVESDAAAADADADADTADGDADTADVDATGLIERRFRRVRSPTGPDTVQFEVTLDDADGREVVCVAHLTLLPSHGDDFAGAVGTLTDITERRRQTELLRYRDGLKDVVLDAATSLMSAEADEIDTKVRWTLQTVGEFVGVDRCRVFCADADGEALFETHVWSADGDDADFDYDDPGAFDVGGGSVGVGAGPAHAPDGGAFTTQRVRVLRTSGFPWLWSHLSRFENVSVSDLSDLPPEASATANVMRTGDVRAAGVVPMVSDWSLTGCVSFEVRHPTEAWSEAELRHLRSVGDIVAYTLARKYRERTLRRQNERLEEFASVVSHDLRNPLSIADGYLDLARENGDLSHLDRVADAIDRMDALVGDVLTLARQGQTVTATSSVDLEDVVREAWRTVDTGAAALRCSGDLGSIEADVARLSRAFENLFRNSVEHGSANSRTESGAAPTGEGREVPVTVTVDRLPNRTGFYVADDGPGVPSEKRDRVFQYGHSGGDGTGIGLAIVERIADAHGWEVSVTDADGGGARFEFDCGTTPRVRPVAPDER